MLACEVPGKDVSRMQCNIGTSSTVSPVREMDGTKQRDGVPCNFQGKGLVILKTWCTRLRSSDCFAFRSLGTYGERTSGCLQLNTRVHRATSLRPTAKSSKNTWAQLITLRNAVWPQGTSTNNLRFARKLRTSFFLCVSFLDMYC